MEGDHSPFHKSASVPCELKDASLLRRVSMPSLQREGHVNDEDDLPDAHPSTWPKRQGPKENHLTAARSIADKFIILCLLDQSLRPLFQDVKRLERLKTRQTEALFAALRFGEVGAHAKFSLAVHRELSEERLQRIRTCLTAAAREHALQCAGSDGRRAKAADDFAARLAETSGLFAALLPGREQGNEAKEQAEAMRRRGGADDPRQLGGLQLAPLRVPIQRRRQMLGCVASCSLIPASAAIMAAALYCWRRTWPLLAAYLPWAFWLDRSPWRGGKAPSKWLRNLWVWKQFAEYFPASLIKANPGADFGGKRPILMGYHPHGILSFGAMCSFGFDVTGWPEKFPGLTPRVCTLDMNVRFPILREILLRLGFISASRNAIKAALKPGSAVVIVVGGAAEALDTKPGEYVLTLARRSGFFRLALESGADLVPCFGFGENDIFDTVTRPDSLLRRLQAKMYKVMTFSTPVFYGRGIFTYNYGPLPYRRPLTTVVGDPIRVEKVAAPTKEQVEEVKAQYIEALRALFAEWQQRLEPGQNSQLIIV